MRDVVLVSLSLAGLAGVLAHSASHRLIFFSICVLFFCYSLPSLFFFSTFTRQHDVRFT